MKNSVTGRDSFSSRVSGADGSIHINSGMRNLHDAQLRTEQFMKRSRNGRQAGEFAELYASQQSSFDNRGKAGSQPNANVVRVFSIAVLVLFLVCLFSLLFHIL